MKLIKRSKITTACLVAIMILSAYTTANAEPPVSATQLDTVGENLSVLEPLWARTIVTVPGTNKSAWTHTLVPEATETMTASFCCMWKSKDRNFDARVVNSPTQGVPEARSAWARNLDVDDLIHVRENDPIAVGYYYQAEISSDLFTYGDVDVDLAFSPDYMSDTSEIPSTPVDLT